LTTKKDKKKTRSGGACETLPGIGNGEQPEKNNGQLVRERKKKKGCHEHWRSGVPQKVGCHFLKGTGGFPKGVPNRMQGEKAGKEPG